MENEERKEVEEMLDEMMLSFLKTVMSKLDPGGFIIYVIDKLHEYGMPTKNIPAFMRDIGKYLHDHPDTDGDETPKFSLDTDELERLMKNEMNGD